VFRLGSRDTADTNRMAKTCDLTDGTQELFVEDGGEMPYSDGTCTTEEPTTAGNRKPPRGPWPRRPSNVTSPQ